MDKIVICEKCGAMVKVLIECTCENCGIKCCGEKMKEISEEEAEKYFDSDIARQCKPTDYAVSGGAYVNSNGNCNWHLRSRGRATNFVAYVYIDGDVEEGGGSVSYFGAVRPALWIDLSKLN